MYLAAQGRPSRVLPLWSLATWPHKPASRGEGVAPANPTVGHQGLVRTVRKTWPKIGQFIARRSIPHRVGPVAVSACSCHEINRSSTEQSTFVSPSNQESTEKQTDKRRTKNFTLDHTTTVVSFPPPSTAPPSPMSRLQRDRPTK